MLNNVALREKYNRPILHRRWFHPSSAGMAAGFVITCLLDERRCPEHCCRACHELLWVAKRYGRTRLVRRFGAIFIGNANPAALAKTAAVKSTLETGLSSFPTLLQYKSIAAGVRFVEVNERFTTRLCSRCSDSPICGRKVSQILEYECECEPDGSCCHLRVPCR